MKVFVGLRSPEVPGFCPSIGAVDTEVAARAPKPSDGVGVLRMCGTTITEQEETDAGGKRTQATRNGAARQDAPEENTSTDSTRFTV